MRFLFVRPEVCQPASFRFRLAADTLAFGYTFPTTGQIPDFHRLETCAAGRTAKKAVALQEGQRLFHIARLALEIQKEDELDIKP